MSFLASAYISGYLALGLVLTMREYSKLGRIKADSLAEIPMDVCLVAAAVAYWYDPVADLLRPVLPLLFVAGVSTLAILLFISTRETVLDPELSAGGRVFIAGGTLLIALLFVSPLLFWGFSAAFLAGG
jgi:hypothetical protein